MLNYKYKSLFRSVEFRNAGLPSSSDQTTSSLWNDKPDIVTPRSDAVNKYTPIYNGDSNDKELNEDRNSGYSKLSFHIEHAREERLFTVFNRSFILFTN